jgi:hypothetical protein
MADYILRILPRVLPANSTKFDRGACLITLGNYPEDSPIFLFGSTRAQPIISLDSCKQICGSSIGWHSDIFPRLNTWLLPVLVLLANLQLPSVSGRNRYWAGFTACMDLLANPIGFTLSLYSQAEAWKHCHVLARQMRPFPGYSGQTPEKHELEVRSVAVLIASFERISQAEALSHEKDSTQAAVNLFETLVETLSRSRSKGGIEFEKEIAQALCLARSNSIFPACLAVVFYGWQVVGSFVPFIGADAQPSGDRLTYPLLLSWILFVVPFSNTIGDFTSSDAFGFQVEKFLALRLPNFEADRLERLIHTSFSSSHSRKDNFRFKTSKNGLKPLAIRFLSCLPVLIGIAFSIAVISLAPTYFNDRHSLVILIGAEYLIAPFVSRRIKHRRQGLCWLLVTDTAIAVIIILFLVLASSGLFNDCRGWTPTYPLNRGVALFPKRAFDDNQMIFYPILVSVCLGMQVVLWLVMRSTCSCGLGVFEYVKSKRPDWNDSARYQQEVRWGFGRRASVWS